MSSSLHSLLLLADSALPLGSFAFSSGLESHLAHHKLANPATKTLPPFDPFLHASLSNLASTTLPYVLHAYRHPTELQELDNDLDASTPCSVARRASIAQGKALLAIWERSLKHSVNPSEVQQSAARDALAAFTVASKAPKSASSPTSPLRELDQVHAHLPPLFGAVALALGLPARETAYIYLLNHAKALLSAAVRASVMGPYQSQAVLASEGLRRSIETCIEREWQRKVEDAGVRTPVMDLWMGRHECLYSRIFNS